MCRAGALPAPRGCAYSYVLRLFWLPRATPLGLASHPRWCRFTLYYDTLLPELIRILLKTVRIITTISSLRLPTYVKICFPPDSSQNGSTRPSSELELFLWLFLAGHRLDSTCTVRVFLALSRSRRPQAADTLADTRPGGLLESSHGICPKEANLFVACRSRGG